MYYIMERAQERHRLSDRLIKAISHRHRQHSDTVDDIRVLIEAGADVNRLHGTLLPLHCACMVGDVEILRLLLRNGAKVNALDGCRRAAIHYASETDEACLEVLLQNGAAVNQGDGKKDTALHWASYKNYWACVRLLLQYGANVNIVDYNNDTPISWAARKGNLQAMKILLDYNADIDMRNRNGETPLQRSAVIQAHGLNTSQDNACLKLLIKASGHFNLLTERGHPMPFIARDNRIYEMLRPVCNHARPLLDLCRRQIRRSLGQVYLPNVVKTLPVPLRLQDFLLLRDGKEIFLDCLNVEDLPSDFAKTKTWYEQMVISRFEKRASARRNTNRTESDEVNISRNEGEEVGNVQARNTHVKQESDRVNSSGGECNTKEEGDFIEDADVQDSSRVTDDSGNDNTGEENFVSARGDQNHCDPNRGEDPSVAFSSASTESFVATTTVMAARSCRNHCVRHGSLTVTGSVTGTNSRDADDNVALSAAVEIDEEVGT